MSTLSDIIKRFIFRRNDGKRANDGSGMFHGERKLNLHGLDDFYGMHRNSFSDTIRSLTPLSLEKGGIDFIPFIERQFVWGDRQGEAASKNPMPLTGPWIGILHCPFKAPPWFEPDMNPEAFFQTDLWQDSLPACKGIICLSRDLERDLNEVYPALPTLCIKLPTSLDAPKFCFEKYQSNPRLIQIGDWLRQLQAIYKIKAVGHQKLMLCKFSTKKYLDRDINVNGDFRNDEVRMIDYVSNEDYDEMMSGSVILCMLYATAANNVIVEAIVRATPIIVNPLPSVVEYLGENYPLYASTMDEAEQLINDPEKIRSAHEYLANELNAGELTYEHFRDSLAGSEFYKQLKA
jgi:hypothetical protein